MKDGDKEEVYVIAKYDYKAQGGQELDMKKHERLMLLDDTKHWWKVSDARLLVHCITQLYPRSVFFYCTLW